MRRTILLSAVLLIALSATGKGQKFSYVFMRAGTTRTISSGSLDQILRIIRQYKCTCLWAELDGRRYLSRKTVELMVSNHLGAVEYNAGMGFGLGFSIRVDLGAAGQPGSEGEFGWGGAYHSTYWVDPEEGLTVAYMTQLLPAGDIDDHGKLRSLIYQAID